MSTPRGVRNNNPGNIRKSSKHWRGLAPAAVQTDPEFFRFVGPEWGIRAMVAILRTYQTKYGLKTVRQLINRWAPPVENDTGAYVTAVAKAIGVGADEPVRIDEGDVMRGLVLAIIRHENGVQPYDIATINTGVRLAGVA